jgi:hypothetical protein
MSAHRLSRTSGGTHDYHGRAVGRGSRLNSKLRKGGMRPARLTRLEQLLAASPSPAPALRPA